MPTGLVTDVLACCMEIGAVFNDSAVLSLKSEFVLRDRGAGTGVVIEFLCKSATAFGPLWESCGRFCELARFLAVVGTGGCASSECDLFLTDDLVIIGDRNKASIQVA